ncbi:PAS domain S-box protein [Mucilaginibacter achroorhodeus]|uniref:PAS domain S-box protein n=1 Tax=Mucilaginibacter achroorhodeus TaxID=2599294 RepID=A0A563U744_9SPHI|nr:PAS domain S-box protein [Mucilaginibacter achroorhodeus]TWR27181.1 PAS domain S-box protein [Mucilaginibacter achroorhodeus]
MRSGALKIAILYVIAGIIWITLSDKLLLALRDHVDLELMLFLSSVKGIAYVLITGIFLYYLIRSNTATIAESEKRYHGYFEENPHPMWITDARTMAFTDVNEAALSFYGYNREEFLRMNLLDISPPEHKIETYSTLRALTHGINKCVSFAFKTKNGNIITVTTSCHLISTKKGGNLMCMVEN